MLAYLRYLLLTYVCQDLNSIPSHGICQLLTSEHLETFHSAFSSALERSESGGPDNYFRPGRSSDRHVTGTRSSSQTTSDATESSASTNAEMDLKAIHSHPPQSEEIHKQRQTIDTPDTKISVMPCSSPTRSDEGYGSYSGDSLDHSLEHAHLGDDTADEIAALGIIDECEEVPDYGVALEPAAFHSISPQKERQSPRRKSSGSVLDGGISPGASPTRKKLAELADPTPTSRRVPSSKAGMSENARHLLSMGYALSIIGEKFEKSRSIEGSVKSVIIKAGQAIEKSQSGSVYGKSRFGGSKYGGSRYGAGSKYGGSKFGGSKRSVARSVVLEETLPDWGF